MSCLFETLSTFIHGDPPDIVRQKICNYIALKKPFPYVTSDDYIRWESALDSNSYVSKMRHESVWGGAIEIQAFCELYNFCILCYDIRLRKNKHIQPIMFCPTSGSYLRKSKIYWDGNHYSPNNNSFQKK
jgi:hypothetical protein